MAPHHQPTPEELDEKIKEAEEASKELEGKQEIPKDEEEEEPVVPETQEEPQSPEEPEAPPEAEEEPEQPPTEEEETEPSKELKEKLKIEVKEKTEKLSASAREAQKLHAARRVVNQAIAEASETPEPTEEELTQEYPDWEVMSDTERKLAKESLIGKRFREKVAEGQKQAEKIEKWEKSVDEFADDPQTLIDNPSLEGKGEDFKEFAKIEENNNIPFKILVSAFLHDHQNNQKKNKGQMFERGLGGSNERPTPKTDVITDAEEVKRLRETDHEKYKKLLMEGKIQVEV